MCGAQRRKHTHKCFRPCGECLILSLNCCAIYKLRASRSFMSRIDYLHAFWMICHSELFRCLCTAAERSEAASRPSLRGRPCVARSNANPTHHAAISELLRNVLGHVESAAFGTVSLSLNCRRAQRGGKPAELARPTMCGA